MSLDIGITETRITENDQSDYQPSIPGYSFEFAPTPLAAGGVGMFIDENVKYRVSPESFQTYFDETLEKLSNSSKPIYVLGDFNINPLNAETCTFTKDFLLSLQSYFFIPTIDKLTRVKSNSATLIDNIFVNQIGREITSSHIISDISDHYSQFCIIKSLKVKELP